MQMHRYYLFLFPLAIFFVGNWYFLSDLDIRQPCYIQITHLTTLATFPVESYALLEHEVKILQAWMDYVEASVGVTRLTRAYYGALDVVECRVQECMECSKWERHKAN